MTNIDTFSYSDGLKCISFRGNVVSINILRLFEAFFCSHPPQTIEQNTYGNIPTSTSTATLPLSCHDQVHITKFQPIK